MQIIPITPRGYCKGVVNAINVAKQCLIDYPNQNIYVLGMIVHNKYVVMALDNLNIKTIENKNMTRLQLLDEIDSGIIIFTAHGISANVKQKAISKGLTCIDASCIDVKKTQDIVINKLKQDYAILYIGKKNHPEAEAICDISNKITLICDDTIPNINNDKIFVTNQTTMSILEIEHINSAILNKYPKAIIQHEICNATTIRQKAIFEANSLDTLFVVGDVVSNNSNKLRDIAINCGIKNVFLIESNLDIKLEYLLDSNRVGITSGASTPTYLTNQVIDCLKNYAITKQVIHQEIDITKIL